MKSSAQSTKSKAKAKKGHPSAHPNQPKRPLSAYNLYCRYKRQMVLDTFSHVDIPITPDAVRAIFAAPAGLENSGVDDATTMSPDVLHALRRDTIRAELEPHLHGGNTKHGWSNRQWSLFGVNSFDDLSNIMTDSWKSCDSFSKSVFEELACESRKIQAERRREYMEELERKLQAESTKSRAQVKGKDKARPGYMKWFRDTKKKYAVEQDPAKPESVEKKQKRDSQPTKASSLQKDVRIVSKKSSTKKPKKSQVSSKLNKDLLVDDVNHDVEVAGSMVQLSKKNHSQAKESIDSKNIGKSRVDQMCALSADTHDLLAKKNVPAKNQYSCKNPASVQTDEDKYVPAKNQYSAKNPASVQADLIDYLAKKKNADADTFASVKGFGHPPVKMAPYTAAAVQGAIGYLAKKNNNPCTSFASVQGAPMNSSGFVYPTNFGRGVVRPACQSQSSPFSSFQPVGDTSPNEMLKSRIQQLQDTLCLLAKSNVPVNTSAAHIGNSILALPTSKRVIPAEVAKPTNSSFFRPVGAIRSVDSAKAMLEARVQGVDHPIGEGFNRMVSIGSGTSSSFSSPQPFEPAVDTSTVDSTNEMLKSRIQKLEETLANERLNARVRELEAEILKTRARGRGEGSQSLPGNLSSTNDPHLYGLAVQNAGMNVAGQAAMMPPMMLNHQYPLSSSRYPTEYGTESPYSSSKKQRFH